jgi:peroxiredoxin
MVSSPRSHTILDIVVNIVILLTCAIMATAVVERRSSSTAKSDRAPKEVTSGEGAETLPGVSYTAAPSTLVLYLSSSCRYCTASMPFFRKLDQVRRTRAVHWVVVSPEGEQIVRTYLHAHELEVDQVVSHQGRIQQTPTLVEVTAKGVVKNVWVGQPTKEQEERILKSIQGN